MLIDSPELHTEAFPPPPGLLARSWRVLLWCVLVLGVGAALLFVLLHIAPTPGAAGGCGGG